MQLVEGGERSPGPSERRGSAVAGGRRALCPRNGSRDPRIGSGLPVPVLTSALPRMRLFLRGGEIIQWL